MLEPFMISHNPAKFSGNRHRGSGDIIVLICNIILQDNVIKEKLWVTAPHGK